MAKNCTLCYLENDCGQYLMLHRVKKQNDVNHDKWIGVGGKFEDGESPEDCVLRETLEETGLTLTDYRYRGIVTFVSDVWETEYMHLFTATGFIGEMKECDEGNLEWVDKSAVELLPIWEGDKLFFRLMENPLQPFFSLKLRYEGDTLTSAVLNGTVIDPKKPPLLISACLLGTNCKYNGGHNCSDEMQQLLPTLRERYTLLPVCPEESGGLPTPRTPSERRGRRVVTASGDDVTDAFRQGAAQALRLAQHYGCSLALLKERSPSCGCGEIYDGTFSGHCVPEDGVTAELLQQHGITVLGESRVRELLGGKR